MIRTILFKNVQLQQQKKMSFTSASYSSKNINEHRNKSPVENENIIIIDTTPEISTSFSPICRKIVIPQINRFRKIKPVNNW